MRGRKLLLRQQVLCRKLDLRRRRREHGELGGALLGGRVHRLRQRGAALLRQRSHLSWQSLVQQRLLHRVRRSRRTVLRGHHRQPESLQRGRHLLRDELERGGDLQELRWPDRAVLPRQHLRRFRLLLCRKLRRRWVRVHRVQRDLRNLHEGKLRLRQGDPTLLPRLRLTDGEHV